ncbi:MAG: GDP-mannose 4,6-dehydratase [Thermoleophilia bacterium]
MTASDARRALVTGGAGFIGSHVVDRLVERGYEVVVVDDLSKGTRENVNAAARLVEQDIVDGPALCALAEEARPAVICHLAAQASVTFSVREPDHDLKVNVLGTLNVLEAARAVGAPVVFASTGGALYGDGAPLPTGEGFAPEPLSPYGAAKLAGEAYVLTWSRLHEMPHVVLRLGNVYGPRQNSEGEAGVVAIFSGRLLAGETPVVYGDGLQTRDYVHVRDVARAFVLAAEGGVPGVFNVGTGRETNVLELLDGLTRAAGVEVEARHEPMRAGELRRSCLDASRIAGALDWRAEVGIGEGLAETLDSYR